MILVLQERGPSVHRFMNYHKVYHRLTTQLCRGLPDASVPQVRNQALVTLALAYSPNCHLATLATLLPVPGQRENLVQRIRRWLDRCSLACLMLSRCVSPCTVIVSSGPSLYSGVVKLNTGIGNWDSNLTSYSARGQWTGSPCGR